MSHELIDAITVPLDHAKVILLARSFEQTGGTASGWSDNDAQACSLRTARALGESADPHRFLLERAKTVLTTLSSRQVKTQISTKARVPQALAWALVLCAFFAGALVDRFASPEHIVNLLSLPFWSVIVWNFAVYLVLFGCAVGLVGWDTHRFSLPLRNALLWLTRKSLFSTLNKGPKAHFYSQWSELIAPLLRIHIARLLHLCAVTFALGLIASLCLRGFGTAYWAGWESTWLAEDTDSIKAFLDWTYGLVPSWGLLPAMPDAQQIAQMRLDRLPYLTQGVSAAPWLIRMMCILTAVVILPRLLFALTDTWRLRRQSTAIRLDVRDAYYQNLFRDLAHDSELGALYVVVDSHSQNAQQQQRIHTLLTLWNQSDTQNAVQAVDFYAPIVEVPAFQTSAHTRVIAVWLDGAQTPETEVLSPLFDSLRAVYARTERTLLVAVIDFVAFSERHRAYPERQHERETLWKTACAATDLPCFCLLPDHSAQCVTQLRDWAGTRACLLEKTESTGATDVKESS